MTQTPKIKAERLKTLPPPSPLEPGKLTDLIIHGVHALADGNATPHQQKKVLEWIINEASLVAVTYQERQRDQDFALGRAFVGQQLIGILRIPMINLAPDETPPERTTQKPKNPKKQE